MKLSAIICLENFLLFLLILVGKVNSKPIDEEIYFKHNNEPINYLDLNDENQILPHSESSRLILDNSEIVKTELENGKFFQGDIVLQQKQKEAIDKNSSVESRTGWLDEYYRWPKDEKGFVIMPYELSSKSQFSEKTIIFFCVVSKFKTGFHSKLPENPFEVCNG
jgi:hypothetical protein